MLSQPGDWLKSNGLVIVLIAIGAVLLARMVRAVATQATRLLAQRAATASPSAAASEDSRYHHAVVQVGEWVAISLIYFVAAILALMHFGLPLTTLVAPATLLGAALGFGAQRIVQDLLSGFFLFAERQFGIGDVVQISQPGSATGTSGTVERLTLRVTELRAAGGELVIIPNGELRQVTNLSRGWSQALVDLPIAAHEESTKVISVLVETAQRIAEDEAVRPLLLDDPVVTGVESIQVGYYTVRITARTLPGRQWEIARKIRQRAAEALREAHISSPAMTVAAPQGPGAGSSSGLPIKPQGGTGSGTGKNG